MNKLLLGSAMALVCGAPAVAQDLFRTDMDPVAITASDFIGKRVYAAEAALDANEYAGVQDGWNDIGEINDVVITRDGKVDSVLLDIGGFLGMGERQVAVSMESIRFVADSATAADANDFFLVVNADRALLEGAPEYIRTGAMPADATRNADTAVAPDATATDPLAPDALATDATIADETTTAATDPAVTQPAADGAKVDGAMMMDGYAAIETEGITSEQLMGTRVYGPNQEDLGEISNLVLDENGAPSQVIVDVGGFLGMGEKPVAIDVTALQMMQATDNGKIRAYVQMTQEQLESMPATKL